MALFLVAAAACSSPAPKADVDPYPIETRIRVRDMPSRLIELYGVDSAEPPKAGFYYRPGTLDSEIAVYRTNKGLVYVDFGGGGQALAIECAVLTDFVKRNGWDHASGCFDGQR